MGCVIKIEDEDGKLVSSFRFKNPERCTILYNNLIADNFFRSKRLTIKLLSDKSEIVSTHQP